MAVKIIIETRRDILMSAKKKVKPEKRFSASNPEKTMDPERMKLLRRSER